MLKLPFGPGRNDAPSSFGMALSLGCFARFAVAVAVKVEFRRRRGWLETTQADVDGTCGSAPLHLSLLSDSEHRTRVKRPVIVNDVDFVANWPSWLVCRAPTFPPQMSSTEEVGNHPSHVPLISLTTDQSAPHRRNLRPGA